MLLLKLLRTVRFALLRVGNLHNAVRRVYESSNNSALGRCNIALPIGFCYW